MITTMLGGGDDYRPAQKSTLSFCRLFSRNQMRGFGLAFRLKSISIDRATTDDHYKGRTPL
jgi:hypothetical protein